MAWCDFGAQDDAAASSAGWKNIEAMKKEQLKGDDGLFWAAYRNDVATINERLRRGDNIDGRREGVQSPLSIAAEQNCVPAVSLLCKAKADVNRADQRGITAIYAAAQNGHAKCVRMLVYAKADVNLAMVDGSTPAFVAAHSNMPEALEVLALSKADVERPEQVGPAAFLDVPWLSASPDAFAFKRCRMARRRSWLPRKTTALGPSGFCWALRVTVTLT